MMEYILIGGFIQSIPLTFYYFLQRKSTNGGIYQFLIVLFISLSLLIDFLYASKKILQFPHFSRLGFLFGSLVGPFLFLYTRSLTQKKKKFQAVDSLFFFIPLGIFLISYPYYSQNADYKIAYLLLDFDQPHLDCLIISYICNLHNMFCMIFSSVLLYKFSNSKEYSGISKVYLPNFHLFILFLGLLFSMALTIINHSIMNSGIYTFLMALLIFIKIFQIMNGDQRVINIVNIYDPPVKYSKSKLNKNLIVDLGIKIQNTFELDKPYLDIEFSPSTLMNQFRISRHELSQVFSGYFGKSFSQITNEYRVKEVIQSMNADSNLLQLSLSCGFSSKSRFNHIFKEFTGLTPSEYKRSKFHLTQ